MSGLLTTDEYLDLLAKLETVFTPSAPIKQKDLFKGRIEEIDKILQSVKEAGQHCIIYGDRGAGKTSISNVVPFFFHEIIPVVKVICNRSDTFKQVWLKAFDQFPIEISKRTVGFRAESIPEIITLSAALAQQQKVTTTDVSSILKYIPESSFVIFLFDEFDTILDKKVKESFADLIKELSDTHSAIKIILVGIASNVTELIGEHPSIARCIRQIKLKRLENKDIEEISKNGYDTIGFTYEDEVINQITKYSCGFGHYAHLLAKYVGKYALSQRRKHLTASDFYNGSSLAIENANESIKEEYRIATVSDNTKDKFKNVLHACAIAESDEHQTFSNSDILEAFINITGQDTTQPKLAYNIGKLCLEDRGEVLVKLPGQYTRYRFKNPLLQAYICLMDYKNKHQQSIK